MDEKTSSKAEKKSGAGKEAICENLSFAAKEAFKRLRTNITTSMPEGNACNVIGVTSAQPSEGKSTVSINLAYSMSELGKKVLLIDADMRRPSIHSKAGIKQTPGLSNLLSDTNAIGSAIARYPGSDESARFDIIPGGAVMNNPSEMLTTKRMDQLMSALRSVYDYIVIDLPPVGAVIDAVSVSKHVDGMLVVIRENNCPRGVFKDCVEQLKFSNVNVLGFVVNGALEGAGKKYQYSYYN